jgi:hypothetical protein
MLRSYQVLGVISVAAGAVVAVKDAFPTLLDPSKGSCYVNTLYFQAHEGNASDMIYVGDMDMTGGDDDTRGTVLAAREYIAFTSGTNANCVDPRDFAVGASSGTKKVRVSVLKV